MMRKIILIITMLFAHTVNSQDENIYYVHNDHNGAPLMMTDQNQRVVWKANYTPFGEAKIEIEEVELPVRYKGQYYDKESGLHYNYFRDYNPATGRYTQSDPIGLMGGLNTYAYVGGNPLSFIDFFGLTVDQVKDMMLIAKLSQPDLNVPDSVGISIFPGFNGERAAITNPITLGVTVSSFYFRDLNCDELRGLLRTIIHESIHRTKPRWDMISRPLTHDDIYEEAKVREEEINFMIRDRCECQVGGQK